MNQKGFTLIELLSVIVLIGVVLSIAVLGVSSVRTSILDKQYENIKAEIELAGEKYYNDTESIQFYVQTLIDEGYLKTDNESKKILDPRNSSELNCFVVNIDKNTEKASLDERSTGDCTENLEGNYGIYIKKENESNPEGDTIEDKWYNSIFKVIAVANSSENLTNNYSWTTDLNPNVISSNVIFDLTSLINERGGALNDVFYVSAVTDSNKVLKSGGKRIKIDTVNPKIEGNIKISNDGLWTKEKTVSITLTDVGSGIKKYIFDTTPGCSSESSWTVLEKSQNKVDINKVFNSTGKFYFCAQDEAGNALEEEHIIEITQVDSTPPTCYYEGEDTNYIRGTRLIKYGCKDEESGCQKIISSSSNDDCNSDNCPIFTKNYTYSGTIITAKIEDTIGKFRIVDKVGNYTDCPVSGKKELNIYLDNKAPVVSITSMSYSSGTLYVNVSLTDEHSGPRDVKVSFKGTSSNSVSCNGSCTVSLNIGSISQGTVTVTGYDKVGNSSSTSKTINMYSKTISGEKDYSGSFTEYLPISGNFLYKTVTPITGSVSCDNNGRCTVYPYETEEKCLKENKPYTKPVEYDDCEGDYAELDAWGYCSADEQTYTNETGHCRFESGTYNGKNFWFDNQCNCSCKYRSSRWYDVYILYECPFGNAKDGYCSQTITSVGVNPSNFYDNGGQICYNIASVHNFGDYTGTKKVYATKSCQYNSYRPNSYCPSSYTKEGLTCYKCGYKESFNSDTLSCEYMSICTVYKYSFSYVYYTYS